MKSHHPSTWLRGQAARLCVPALAALALSPAFVDAKPVVRNLGGGLQQIATPAGRAKSLTADQKGQKVVESRIAGAELVHPVVFDLAGRPLVRITLHGKVPAATVMQDLRGMAGVEVKASDPARAVLSGRHRGAGGRRCGRERRVALLLGG